ncbi:hypothetical protein Tco_0749304 [Tanacetum coccineum]|uniref:MAK10-like protein n=1 Tax=Tanacetum coccineum TaxID=301880 RepID=A0ABQ4Z1J0_9ASTR
MGDENPILTLEDYSKPSYEGYKNTIELPVGNNVVPFRSDTIRLVQNECSFHGLRSQDPNQHLKDFLKLVDSLDLDRSITTWEDLTTRFLAQFFPPRRTAKLRNDILINTGTQDNQGHDERMDDPTLEPSICKIKRFEMMKYSFNLDEEYIAIKESEYLNHSKDSLDAYRELLRIINKGWVVPTADEE